VEKLQGPWIKRILMLALGVLGFLSSSFAAIFQRVSFGSNLALIAALSFVTLCLSLLYSYNQKRLIFKLKQQILAHTSHTPLAICVFDRNFTVIDWNENAEKLFGYSKAEALGRNGKDLIIPPELQSSIGQLFGELLRAEGGFRSTNENITRDGKRLICDWYNTPIKNSKGEVIAITSLALDISERLRAAVAKQNVLKKSREEQMALVHLATHKFVIEGRVNEALPLVTEVSSKILSVKRCSIWLFSSDRQELICSDLFDSSSSEHIQGAILRAADYPAYFNALYTGRAVDAEDAAEDPRTCEFRDEYLKRFGISSMLDATIRVAGKVVGVVCNEHVGKPRRWTASEIAFATDIADLIAQILVVKEREEALKALRQSEEIFRQLTENIKGVFWLTSPDKKIAYYISPAFNEIWGRGAGYYYSDPMKWIETVHPDDRELVNNSIPLQRTGKYDMEYRIIRPDGSIRWIRDRAFPILNQEKEVIRIAGICEDVTESRAAIESRAEMERQLQQTQKMEALGRLAGGIAHDFNNILSAITGYAQLLRDEMRDDLSKSSMLDSILIGTSRAKNLVKQILAFSRQSDSKLESVDLAGIVKEVCKLLEVSLPPQISLKTSLDCDCLIKADPSQIFQVVMNICTNAIYAMKDNGGTLFLSLYGEPESSDQGEKLSKNVVLKVKDTGLGIPKDIQDRIFEPFFTTKPMGEGTGLGLSVVHGVIKGLGGSIEIASKEGAGTEFTIKLPDESAAGGVAQESEQAKLVPANSATVLLVDDEEMIGRLFGEVLRRNGYKVLLARESSEALDLIEQNSEISLMVTDLTMPGLSGTELIKKVKEIRPQIKAILCSGYDPGAIPNNMNSLIACRLWKPFSIHELLRAVKETLSTLPTDKVSKAPARAANQA